MKINESLKTNTGLTGLTPESKANKNAEATKLSSDNDNDDKVTLSGRSAELKNIVNGLSDETFDANKVEAIKAAILDGQFKVNPEKVADGLINTVKDLLSTQKA